jgi:RimJ/RimL family protein N-acetyltransferase
MNGDRVELRPWCPADAAFAFDMYSRWDVQRYLGRDPKVMVDPAQADVLIARLAAVVDPVLGYWVVQLISTGELVGTVMLQGIRLTGADEPSNQIEIGWHFHPDAWGRGYATEAAKTVMQHGFDAGVERIIAVTHPDNSASQRICHRFGMKDEGVTNLYYDVECELFVATGTPN